MGSEIGLGMGSTYVGTVQVETKAVMCNGKVDVVELGCMRMFLYSVEHYMWFAFTVQGGRTPLLLAAERGHTDLVKLITEQYKGDIFHKMKV